MNQYFYRLGHVPELAVAELNCLTGQESNFQHDRFWAVSDAQLNVLRSGSLVYGGRLNQVLAKSEINDLNLSQALRSCLTALKQYLPQEKKLGIAIEHNLGANNLIGLGKDAGFKKINVLSKGKWPNFGNWKGTNAWVIGFWLRGNFYLGFLTSYADQEFWSRLDQHLPHADMRRGIINLKLARSLMNMAQAPIVWDPFCGQGRLLIAGADLKQELWGSDIDPVCLPEARANWEIAKANWQSEENGELQDIFELDAKNLNQFIQSQAIDTRQLAIVTEGYLGFNFNKQPRRENIQNELQHQERLWTAVLNQAKEAGIREVVFCLPFYDLGKQTVYPEFIHKLSKELGFALICEVPYRRKDTITGHYVVKVILES